MVLRNTRLPFTVWSFGALHILRTGYVADISSGLCRRQLSRFAHEQVLYPPHLLALHDPSRLSRGQRPPRPRGKKEEEMVAGWGAPHPMCEVRLLCVLG